MSETTKYKNWKLIWEDDFNGSSLDGNKWNVRLGNWITDSQGRPVISGWGNREKQYYTGALDNLYLKDGCLYLTARRQPSPEQFGQRCSYTSARIDTHGHFSFRYGKVEFRARCPLGTGLWPAVWMLPEKSVYGPWAASGEIDILEAKGRLPRCVFGTIHYGGVSPDKTLQEYSHELPAQESIGDFHVYELIWEERCIRWLIDGTEYASASSWESADSSIVYPQPFDQPFYLLINLAVGGWFDMDALDQVDESSLPAHFIIDYIRVYQ